MSPTAAAAWLGRVNHDLVKRLLWSARDRRELGGPVRPGELVAALIDDEGAPITAGALWDALRAEGAAELRVARAVPAADRFRAALDQAVAAAARDDLPGVLALEAAFAELTTAVAGGDERKP